MSVSLGARIINTGDIQTAGKDTTALDHSQPHASRILQAPWTRRPHGLLGPELRRLWTWLQRPSATRPQESNKVATGAYQNGVYQAEMQLGTPTAFHRRIAVSIG